MLREKHMPEWIFHLRHQRKAARSGSARAARLGADAVC